METVAAIFGSRAEAEKAIQQIHSQGIPNDRIALLTPGMDNQQVEQAVPTADSEQPGMGKAMGGTVGGALGVAGGASLGVAVASLLVPGVGPVIAGGILGAAILGTAGTATGMVAGKALEEELVRGLPHDELYLYEDALEKGCSVVIAFAETAGLADGARTTFERAGAEDTDAARESWWLGLRDAEAAEYETTGSKFETDEAAYRSGFETALMTRGTAGKEAADYEGSSDESSEAFQSGYRRGKSYLENLQRKHAA